MKRVLLASTAFALTAATASALAADLPRWSDMPVKARYRPTFSWTGFYVGVNGGGAFGNSTYTLAGLVSPSLKTSGGLAGGTIGFNYQTGPWVWGA
jgi:outer membrane immunogenic protein